VSTLDHKLEPEVTAVRRLELLTGTGRRRQFTGDFKARVVEETLTPSLVRSFRRLLAGMGLARSKSSRGVGKRARLDR
jgi:transposase-like protein